MSVEIGNSSGLTDNDEVVCSDSDPTAQDMLNSLPTWAVVVLIILSLFACLSLIVYMEEIVFIHKHFPAGSRRNKTLWILAFFPAFSVTALLAVIIPRSSTIVDIVAHAFFATCLYQFTGLITLYLGGTVATYQLLSQPKYVPTNVPPLCCCCIFLPKLYLNKKSYQVLQLSAVQFTIVRPLLMFTAAVLWSNGSYIAGYLSANSPYIYILSLNLLTTLIAMYGLMLLKRAFHAELEKQFRLTLKVSCIQLALIASVTPKLIIGILVTTGVIGCTDLLRSKARAEVISHAVTTVVMALFGILAIFAFRRKSDATNTYAPPPDRLGEKAQSSDVTVVCVSGSEKGHQENQFNSIANEAAYL